MATGLVDLHGGEAEDEARLELVCAANRYGQSALHIAARKGSLRMLRLLLAIAYENVATGIALTALVAYLSGVVSKRYTAIQYALLSSLTFLVGTLGRGVVGEAFDRYGYAPVFRMTALAGVVSASFVLLEWVRVRRNGAMAAEDAMTA